MPTYEYECLPNGHRFEVKQSFTDPTLTECVECGEPVRKIYSAAGIVFKGSGYYVTDSRKPAPSNGSSSSSDGSSDKSSSDKGSADKSSTEKTSGEKSSGDTGGGKAKPAAAPAKADAAKSSKSA